MFAPLLEPCSFLVAGAGHSVYLRSMKVRQVTRREKLNSGIQVSGRTP